LLHLPHGKVVLVALALSVKHCTCFSQSVVPIRMRVPLTRSTQMASMNGGSNPRGVEPTNDVTASTSAPGDKSDDDGPDLEADFKAGIDFGKKIRSRFLSPQIDDPGLPFADSLVCVCGSLFVAAIALKGGIPFPGWLAPLPGVPVDGYRGLPYILPAFSHGTGLAFCWLLGALAASAFEAEAYMGSWQEALSRTWRGGAFATGLLLLATQ
jgi:hypothetical protein